MTISQKLHAFARQLCMDRNSHWWSIYHEISKDDAHRVGEEYTDEAYKIFPRYNVDQAVLRTIEQLNSDQLPPFEELRRLLVEAALTGSSEFTEPTASPVHNTAMAEERQWLARRFELASPTEVANQPPLFYRRVLTEGEADEVRRCMKVRWGTDAEGYWFPIDEKSHPSLVAYELSKVDEAALQGQIRAFFAEQKAARLFEIREWGPSYEVEAGSDDFIYNGAEGYWTDRGHEWIVYCSHEGTITFGGKLAEAVRHSFSGEIVEF